MLSLLAARKSIRLPAPNYLGDRFYFITLCSFHKRNVFTTPARCQWLIAALSSEAAACHFAIHAFCLMPDHLHFLAQGLDSGSNLLRFVKTFKIKTSRHYVQRMGKPLWQHSFFDHVLRPSESVESFAWYIWLNPVRRRLVATPEQYPYSGSFSGMRMPTAWRNFEFQPDWK